MMKQFILVLSVLLSLTGLRAQESPSKPLEFAPAFEIEDTSEVFEGGLHTVIKGSDQWVLLDGYDIQTINNSDSLYATSELYIQNLGGELYLGNRKSGVNIYGIVRLDTLNFGSAGGIQTRASSEIAFGNITKGILPGPVISSGTGNYSVSWNVVESRYEIAFDDYDYNLNGYTTVVTPRGSDVHRWRADGSKTSDELYIYLYNSLGSSIRSSFQFVTYFFDDGKDYDPSGEVPVLLAKENEQTKSNKRNRR